jgi:hypothetical protein
MQRTNVTVTNGWNYKGVEVGLGLGLGLVVGFKVQCTLNLNNVLSITPLYCRILQICL